MKYQIIIPENIHATNISQGEQGVLMHLELYVFTCKHVATVNERRGHVFERESRVVYGRVWKEERQGGDLVIIL